MKKMDIDKIKAALERLVDKDTLDAIRAITTPGEEWRVSPSERENVQSLLDKAQAEAEADACAEKVVKLSELPDDLVSAIFNLCVSESPGCQFRLYGYKPMVGGTAGYYYRGKKVYAAGTDALLAALYKQGDTTNGIAQLPVYATAEDYANSDRGWIVAAEDFERRWEENAYWYAVVSGNAVAAKAAFEALGYNGASAIAPTQVRLRPATPAEITS